MKLLRIDFDDESMPRTAQFELTVPEMVLLYNLTGRIAPLYVTQAAGGDQTYGEANDDIAGCLAGEFFNRFWDSGAGEAGPRFGITDIAARHAEDARTRVE